MVPFLVPASHACPLTGSLTHLKALPNLPCWHPSGRPLACFTDLGFCRIFYSETTLYFSDTTCTPAAGWAKYLPCGTQSRTTVLWLGACWGPAGCKCSMRVVGSSTHSQTKTTSTQCCLSPRSIPPGMRCWVGMLLGACTCSLAEACGCFQLHGTKKDDLIRVHVFG